MEKDFIYLASASPRRRELLEQIGVRFVVRAADVDETPRRDEPADGYVERIAAAKAAAVWRSVAAEGRVVLAADTAVVAGGEIFGKPDDEPQALAMLEALSGRSHEVLTAVVARLGERETRRVSRSEVRFRATTAAQRRAYARTGEPYGKAGGYAIQGLGAVFVERLSGSYSSVVGLPLFETAALLEAYGLPDWLGPGSAQS